MHTLLEIVYNALCFFTEDAVAHGLVEKDFFLLSEMNALANKIGDYLDEIE